MIGKRVNRDRTVVRSEGAESQINVDFRLLGRHSAPNLTSDAFTGK